MYIKKAMVFCLLIFAVDGNAQIGWAPIKVPRLNLYYSPDVFTTYQQDTLRVRTYLDEAYLNLYGYENFNYSETLNADSVVVDRIGLLLNAKSTNYLKKVGIAMFGNTTDTCVILFQKDITTVTHGRSLAVSIDNTVKTFKNPSNTYSQEKPYTTVQNYKLQGYFLLHGDSAVFNFSYKNKNKVYREGELILNADTLTWEPAQKQINKKGKIFTIENWEQQQGIVLFKNGVPQAAIDYYNNPHIIHKFGGLSGNDDLIIAAFLLVILAF